MRKAAFIVAPFTLLAGGIFACESDDVGGGPPVTPDASPPALDAGRQTIDASPPDAPPAPAVTVTVTGRSGPTAGVRVVFHDASGAPLETTVTGADGKAKSTGALPAMASALLARDYARHIVTWTGLEDGDDLALREPDSSDEATLGYFDVAPPGGFNAPSVRYDFRAGGCSDFSNESPNGTIALAPYCVTGPESAVLVRALDPDGQTLAHSFKKTNLVPTGGESVPVATGQWATPTAVTVDATNVPPNSAASVALLEVADGHGYEDGYSQSIEHGPVTFSTATGFAEALQAQLTFFPENLGSRQQIIKRVAPGTAIAFDAAEALPAITGAEVSGGDARRPVFSWEGSTVGTDGGIVRVSFQGPEEAHYDWTFIVAPGATTVTAPAMPAEAEAFLPAPTDAGAQESFWYPEVVFLEADVIPSYAAFRRAQGTLVPPGTSLVYDVPALPANGTYRTTSYDNAR